MAYTTLALSAWTMWSTPYASLSKKPVLPPPPLLLEVAGGHLGALRLLISRSKTATQHRQAGHRHQGHRLEAEALETQVALSVGKKGIGHANAPTGHVEFVETRVICLMSATSCGQKTRRRGGCSISSISPALGTNSTRCHSPLTLNQRDSASALVARDAPAQPCGHAPHHRHGRKYKYPSGRHCKKSKDVLVTLFSEADSCQWPLAQRAGPRPLHDQLRE
jgi:hypothetical protein